MRDGGAASSARCAAVERRQPDAWSVYARLTSTGLSVDGSIISACSVGSASGAGSGACAGATAAGTFFLTVRALDFALFPEAGWASCVAVAPFSTAAAMAVGKATSACTGVSAGPSFTSSDAALKSNSICPRLVSPDERLRRVGSAGSDRLHIGSTMLGRMRGAEVGSATFGMASVWRIWASLSRRRHNLEQGPWRKVGTLALRTGFLDLDRKGGLLTLHLINDFGLETTLIWGLGR